MEYVLYRCPLAGCKTIQAKAGECSRHQQTLDPVKMVDAAPYRIAERTIRAIAGGHIEDPTAAAVATMDAMYPALAALDTEGGFAKGHDTDAESLDSEYSETSQAPDRDPAYEQDPRTNKTDSAERVRNMHASDPMITHESSNGPPNIQSQQGGD